jgi:hypothetical protein
MLQREKMKFRNAWPSRHRKVVFNNKIRVYRSKINTVLIHSHPPSIEKSTLY